ncbi:RluA family pseudouridine synthase [Butyrivibrio sp. JL13D10]|uniref:RluA family pseudouridine synthase n=1 Tax=Butyrivibrio sp. JL13D10 TaxID=3236815 RepID=UPI0038B501CD
MREIKIDSNAEGKRLDKFLGSYFSECSMGFLFKMLRKKNITLNSKKADGKEKLKSGDVISVFFSDETFDKFVNKHAKTGRSDDNNELSEFEKAFKKYHNIDIVYEDDNILLLNKPAGILSQKAERNDLSMNEWLLGYLLDKKAITSETLSVFRPSVCNRLDRNTSGLLICSKSLIGAQKMSEILRNRSLHKFYKTIVVGTMDSDASIYGFLYKDEKTNTVKLYNEIPKSENINTGDFSEIKTSYKVLRKGILNSQRNKTVFTELEVLLHTGKTHQIRAHLASTGHPIIGDSKYGDSRVNLNIKDVFGLKYQLLHSSRLEFPQMEGELSYLSGKIFEADTPAIYNKISDSLF